MRQWVSAAIAVAMFSVTAGQAKAAYINTALPSNAYITKNGFDWAWASPLPANSGGFDLSYQAQFGWRIPTAQELTLAPLATDFLIPNGNVPFNGTDPVSGAFFSAINSAYESAMSAGAVATPYFSTSFHHADWFNGLGQGTGPWAGMPGAAGIADQLVIRESAAVPEPASLALFGVVGLGAAGYYRLRRRNAVPVVA